MYSCLEILLGFDFIRMDRRSRKRYDARSQAQDPCAVDVKSWGRGEELRQCSSMIV